MEYEWYAWIQKLTIKEKRRVPSCLGWDLQNSWNCWDQKYLLIVLGRKNDWPPAYFLFIVGISLHGGFSCTRFTREHKQKREVALYSCCASQKPLNYWYQEIKQSCTGRMIFPVLIFPRFRRRTMPVVITLHAIVSPESTKRKERGGIMFGFGVSKPLSCWDLKMKLCLD